MDHTTRFLGRMVKTVIAAFVLIAILFAVKASTSEKPITTNVKINDAHVNITYTIDFNPFTVFDEGVFIYTTKSGWKIKTRPMITHPWGFKPGGKSHGWSKDLSKAPRRKMSFTLANPPREPYCLRLDARAYGRGSEASNFVEFSGSSCTG